MNTTTSEQTLTAAELQNRNNRHQVETRHRARGEMERISKGSNAPQPHQTNGQIGRESRSIAPNLAKFLQPSALATSPGQAMIAKHQFVSQQFMEKNRAGIDRIPLELPLNVGNKVVRSADVHAFGVLPRACTRFRILSKSALVNGLVFSPTGSRVATQRPS